MKKNHGSKERSLCQRRWKLFYKLLLLGGIKQALRITGRSGGGVAVCLKKRFLSCDPSLLSNTKTVTVSSTLKFSIVVSSADLTD